MNASARERAPRCENCSIKHAKQSLAKPEGKSDRTGKSPPTSATAAPTVVRRRQAHAAPRTSGSRPLLPLTSDTWSGRCPAACRRRLTFQCECPLSFEPKDGIRPTRDIGESRKLTLNDAEQVRQSCSRPAPTALFEKRRGALRSAHSSGLMLAGPVAAQARGWVVSGWWHVDPR